MSPTRKIASNIASGFAVSMVGTLPLGYLNLIALALYIQNSLAFVIQYALGIVCVEMVAVRLTMLGAEWLVKRKKIVWFLELLTIVFMLAFALYYFFISNQNWQENQIKINTALPPFILGVVMNSINFMQYPFWAGWNTYLITNHRLTTDKPYYWWYIVSTAAGTFCGIMLFVISAYHLLQYGQRQLSFAINLFFGATFSIIAIVQTYKFALKYFKK